MLNRVKQSALADEMGVSQATISRWESGTLLPDAREAPRLMRLFTARPTSVADRALLHLVTASTQPMHLICDLTHRLLAVSPGRASEWRVAASELMGTPVWRFASKGIVRGEAALGDQGWYEPIAPEVLIETERVEYRELTIWAGFLHYARMPLSNGSFARLVWDGVRTGDA